MTKRIILLAASALVASLAFFAFGATASADETAANGANGTHPGTITLKPTTVVGHPKRPSVVIEVARAKPEVKLADLADPAVEKIVRAASKAPF